VKQDGVSTDMGQFPGDKTGTSQLGRCSSSRFDGSRLATECRRQAGFAVHY